MIALIFAAVTGSLDPPSQWTQMRLSGSNNAVVRGSLETTWTVRTKGAFSSSPAIAGTTLYLGNNNGELYAVNVLTGKVLWSTKVANPLMSAPIVAGNLVIVGEGNEQSPSNGTPSNPIHVGTAPNEMIAYDRNSGALVWRKSLQGSGMAMPAVIDGILVQHNGGGYLNGFNPATGTTYYARNVHSFASMSAALPLGHGRFASNGVAQNAVFLFNAKDGSTVWSATFSPIASGIGDCPLASDGTRLYCDYVTPPTSAVPMQTERRGVFRAYAIDAGSGKKLWDVELERGVVPKRNESAIPLLSRGLLYLGSSVSHYVHALDPATGAVRWRMYAHGAVKSALVEVGGVLYFGDLGGYLWAVNASNGAVIGSRKMREAFNVGSPVVAGQTLIIGGRNGTIFAVPLATIRSSHDR